MRPQTRSKQCSKRFPASLLYNAGPPCRPSVLTRRLLAIRRLDIAKGALSSIQLVTRVIGTGLELHTRGDGLVAPESLAHVNHAALALAVALLELLAACGQRVDERGAKAVGGRVLVDHDAVGVLQAFGQCGTYGFQSIRTCFFYKEGAREDIRMSLQEDGMVV